VTQRPQQSVSESAPARCAWTLPDLATRYPQGTMSKYAVATLSTAILALTPTLHARAATAAETATTPSPLAIAVGAYGSAWASRDVAKILAMHSDDTEFTLFVDGVPTARGRDAVRAQFQWVLNTNPTYTSRITKVDLAPDLAVIQYTIQMTPKAPFVMGRWRYVPTGGSYDVRAIDVLRFREGKVTVKQTYLDTESIRHNSRVAEPASVP
jgi:ketosteroid isomerase-like protein